MPLSQKDRQQLLGFLIFLGLGAIGAYWYFLWNPKRADMATIQTEIDSLTAQVDSARADLAAGTVEDLRQRIARFETNLAVMRRLVPTQNEVTVLIDDIASRAALRGVEIAQFNRQTADPGEMFDTHRYGFSVFGHYDEVGEFLTDIARLERIMVPYNLSLQPAQEQEQLAYGDTTGALLRVDFQLRTFVKTQTAGGARESS